MPPFSSCLCCWRHCHVLIRESSSPRCPACSLCSWTLHQLSSSSWRLCFPGCWHSPPAHPWLVSHCMYMNIYKHLFNLVFEHQIVICWYTSFGGRIHLVIVMIMVTIRVSRYCIASDHQRAATTHCFFSSIHIIMFVAQLTWVYILVISLLFCCSLLFSPGMLVKEVQHVMNRTLFLQPRENCS